MRPFCFRKRYKMKKLTSLIVAAALFASALCACSFGSGSSGSDEISLSFEAMDTFISAKLYGAQQETVDKIESEIKRLDSELSVVNAEGENNYVYRLNRDGSAQVSDDVAELARQSLELCKSTNGALDVTVYPFIEEWGFVSKDYKIPSKSRLSELSGLVNYSNVAQSGSNLSFKKEGMKLDFGAVAKGYAADMVQKILKDNASSAIVNLGGTVLAFGKKHDESLWRVGIADPDNSAAYMGMLSCTDKIIATSGSYERCFTGEDGKTYSHIIDPKTGIPVDNGILSVTIISDSGLRSDALSTALFVMGKEGAEKYYRENKDFDYIILAADKKAYVTAGVYDDFKLADGYDYKTIIVE